MEVLKDTSACSSTELIKSVIWDPEELSVDHPYAVSTVGAQSADWGRFEDGA